MLPARARLRAAADFRTCVRQGVRAGRRTLVVHAHRPSASSDAARVGFVVSKAVGNAVVRNRVKRRLRHLSARELAATPLGTTVVVRALPPAAEPTAPLGADLHDAWAQVVRRLDR